MPTYITVKVTPSRIDIEFNDISSNNNVNAKDAEFKRSALLKVWHSMDPNLIDVTFATGDRWQLNLDGSEGGMPISWIDLGDGNGQQTPANMDELHALVKQIIIE